MGSGKWEAAARRGIQLLTLSASSSSHGLPLEVDVSRCPSFSAARVAPPPSPAPALGTTAARHLSYQSIKLNHLPYTHGRARVSRPSPRFATLDRDVSDVPDRRSQTATTAPVTASAIRCTCCNSDRPPCAALLLRLPTSQRPGPPRR